MAPVRTPIAIRTRLERTRKRAAIVGELWGKNVRTRGGTQRARQYFVPRDALLGKKIGVAKGEKVLVVAGYYGDWARALAKFSNVTYSDISREVVKHVRKKRGKIGLFRVAAGEKVPRLQKMYDWSFSFEPFPMLRHGSVELMLIRSLLNRKGAKIVVSSRWDLDAFDGHAEQVARLYGAKVEKGLVEIQGSHLVTDRKNISCSVLTLRTNNEARKKAALDLKVMNETDKAEFYGKGISAADLAQKLGVPEKGIFESLERAHVLAEVISEAYNARMSARL